MRSTWTSALVSAIGLTVLTAPASPAAPLQVRSTDRLHGCVTWVTDGAAEPADRADGDRYVEDRLCVSGDADRVVGVAVDASSDHASRWHSTCTWREVDQGAGYYEYAECSTSEVTGPVDGDTIRVSETDERFVVIRGDVLGCAVDLTLGPRLGADAPDDEATATDLRSRSWSESGAAPVAGHVCDVDLDGRAPRGELYWQHSDSRLGG